MLHLFRFLIRGDIEGDMTNPADLAGERERENHQKLIKYRYSLRQEEATSYLERQHGHQCWIERMTRNLKDDIDG